MITLETPRADVGLSHSSVSGYSRPAEDAIRAGPPTASSETVSPIRPASRRGPRTTSMWAPSTVADTSMSAHRGDANTRRLATAWSTRPEPDTMT